SATPFAVGPVGGADGPTKDFTVVVYEAGPGLLFSIDEDESSEWLGTFQEMSAGPLKAMHVKRGPLSQEPIETETLTSRQFGGCRQTGHHVFGRKITSR
ncbi:MAG: hypothetical protein WBQ74_22580, partial [Candidatus Sulfotelmatobacter sp.]